MGNTGLVTLGSIRLQSQQRANMENSTFVTTTEWNQYISNSYKELYDLLITAYGNEYYVASPYAFTTSNSTNLYPLPNGTSTVDAVTSLVAVPFYKMIGLDLRVTSSPSSWISVRKFEFTERNKYWLANQYSYYGITNLRYRIVGSNLWLNPVPVSNQTMQLWYIPEPTNLQVTIVAGTTNSSTTVTVADTTQLSVGMTVYGTNIPTGATISSITLNTSMVISVAATATASNQLLIAWIDTTTFDGISGWEEYVVIDAAIKALIKEESDIQGLVLQKEAMLQRINEVAESRDAGIPSRVTDTQSIDYGDGCNGYGGDSW